MSTGSWVMLAIGCIILYGGLIVCLYKAAGSKQYTDEDFEEDEEETF